MIAIGTDPDEMLHFAASHLGLHHFVMLHICDPSIFLMLSSRSIVLEPRFWSKLSEQYFRDQLKIKENKKVADNVIIFIGDGLGPTTVTAARILRGQINGRPGEENILNFEKFPNIALSKVMYNI